MVQQLTELMEATASGVLTAAGEADVVVLVALLMAVTLWLASGCWASSIAETRGRGPVRHLLAGLMLPWLYPLTILFALRVKTHAGQSKEPVEEPPPVQTIGAGAEISDAEFGKSYFDQIAGANSGEIDGGLVVAYGENEVLVKQIVETLPQVVVVEIETAGGTRQRIRIPYERIGRCLKV